MDPGITIQFQKSGIYTTSDPYEQYYLDLRVNEGGDIVKGKAGLEAWQKVYLTAAQRSGVAFGSLPIPRLHAARAKNAIGERLMGSSAPA